MASVVKYHWQGNDNIYRVAARYHELCGYADMMSCESAIRIANIPPYSNQNIQDWKNVPVDTIIFIPFAS